MIKALIIYACIVVFINLPLCWIHSRNWDKRLRDEWLWILMPLTFFVADAMLFKPSWKREGPHGRL